MFANFDFPPSLTVECLRGVAKSVYGIHVKLTHLDQELRNGLLADHGVGPGSLIVARRLSVNVLRRGAGKVSSRPKKQ